MLVAPTVCSVHSQPLAPGRPERSVRAQINYESRTLDRDEVVEGIAFKRGSELSVLADSKALVIAVPKSPTTVHGITFAPGSELRFTGSGQAQLMSASFREPHTIQGMSLSAGSKLIQASFDQQQHLSSAISTEAPLTVNGLSFVQNAWLAFFPSGHIDHGTLAKDAVVNGIAVGPGTAEHWRGYNHDINFYPDGKLQYAFLARAQKLQGLTLEANYPLFFFNNGRLAGGTLAGAQSIGGIKCIGHFSLYDNGKPQYVYLADDQTVQGKPYKAGEQLHFDKDGKWIGWGGSKPGDWMKRHSVVDPWQMR